MTGKKPWETMLAMAGVLLTISALAACASSVSGDKAMPKDAGAGAAMDKKDDAMAMEKLPDQMIAAHFVGSTPKHGETLVAVPDKLALNFDFTLNKTSAISVTKDGGTVAVAAAQYDERSLMMSTTLPKTAGNGLYVVKYKACWPDNSCHDGQFAFTVKSN